MRKILSAGIIVGLLSPISLVLANMELEDACYGDVDIAEFVNQATKSGAVPSSDYLSQAEVAQISGILTNESVVSLSSNEKFKEVMKACVEGRIFQDRNSGVANQ